MEMILLDWTRMGSRYCIAGAVAEGESYRIVRPVAVAGKSGNQRQSGWPGHALKDLSRWSVVELIGPMDAAPEPPHLEDVWVRSMRPARNSAGTFAKKVRDWLFSAGPTAVPAASRELRCAVLATTTVPATEPLFGAALSETRASAFLPPATGQRSLVTIHVAGKDIVADGSWRVGMLVPDLRVRLPLPGHGERWLPVKDHHLLTRVQAAGGDVKPQVAALDAALKAMGERVAVRLGLSRPFQHTDNKSSSACWLMADGFFSLDDPQA